MNLTSTKIIFIRYLVTISDMLNKLQNITSTRICQPDFKIFSIKGINNVIDINILDNNSNNIQNLFILLEKLIKIPLPNQIQAINNNKKFLIEKSQYNSLLECILHNIIVKFFYEINKSYIKNNNDKNFTKTFENTYKDMQDSCYKFRLQFDNFKQKLNEYAYSNNASNDAKIFVTEFINNLGSKQNELESVKNLITKYSKKYINNYVVSPNYTSTFFYYPTTKLDNLIEVHDFSREVNKIFYKIKLNIYTVNSLLNCVSKRKEKEIPNVYIYCMIAEFIGNEDNDLTYTYLLIQDNRTNNKKYSILPVDINKTKDNNFKNDYSNSNIKTEKVTEKIYNYEQLIVKINYKEKQDHHS